MTHEVVVVGGGVGGLTVAALLASRGVDVCLLERESQTGGCIAPFEAMDYSFEPGTGLYARWEPGEIHARVFAELPINPPETKLVTPAYVVRLPDGIDFPVESDDDDRFYSSLQKFFPECAAECVKFYQLIAQTEQALRRFIRRTTNPALLNKRDWLSLLISEPRLTRHLWSVASVSLDSYLQNTSLRFRKFIDVQLQALTGQTSRQCPFLSASLVLMLPRRGLYTMRGGELAESLAESIKQSGGRVRTETTALRLARDQSGSATGVILLSGEVISASRAVISNLTVWDTYGKLIGLNQTPASIRAKLKTLRGWGCYLLFLSMREEAVTRLPANHIIALLDWEEKNHSPLMDQFILYVAPNLHARAPQGQAAMTISTLTDVDDWFAFHDDDSGLESLDQTTAEYWWDKLHRAIPELGDSVELIETATPRTYYEKTRRKLGMVGGLGPAPNMFSKDALTHRTFIPNLYLVGDTVYPGYGVAAVTHSAMIVANEIAPPLK